METLIVMGIVALAAGFVCRRMIRALKGAGGCACGASCANCCSRFGTLPDTIGHHERKMITGLPGKNG